LNAPDVVRRFLQKCRFALRKPPFYRLNYRNKDNLDFRLLIASKQATKNENKKGPEIYRLLRYPEKRCNNATFRVFTRENGVLTGCNNDATVALFLT
jgi:hypothetical protein